MTIEWRAAEPLFARFGEVAHWLDAAIPHRNAFVKAWNASLRPRRKDHVTG